jgi:hypothetical protein
MAKKEFGLDGKLIANCFDLRTTPMLWDVWIIKNDRARILLRNATKKQFKELEKAGLRVFRVPSGFLVEVLRFIDDGIDIN